MARKFRVWEWNERNRGWLEKNSGTENAMNEFVESSHAASEKYGWTKSVLLVLPTAERPSATPDVYGLVVPSDEPVATTPEPDPVVEPVSPAKDEPAQFPMYAALDTLLSANRDSALDYAPAEQAALDIVRGMRLTSEELTLLALAGSALNGIAWRVMGEALLAEKNATQGN